MGIKERTASLSNLIGRGNIALYGYRGKDLPDVLLEKERGEISVFVKEGSVIAPWNQRINVRRYRTLLDTVQEDIDVCFLDGEAIKMLVTKFPQRSRYIFVRLVPRSSWFFGFFGLIRRFLKGHIKVRGVTRLKTGDSSSLWLLLEKRKVPSYTNFSFSSEIGVQGLLNYFGEERIRYVVLRFYEKLPELHRDGGDLDILVADEDEERVIEFLRAHEGDINVDLYSVSSRKAGGIPYYPPPLARKILENAVEGPAGARIPGPREAFLSFAYHVVYHKGSRAGVPSSIPGIHILTHPQNDYAGVLAEMAQKLGIKVDITLEDLDAYLFQEGWRPKLDTLAKISAGNEWVLKRFFTSPGGLRSVGLGVFILKEKAIQLNLVEPILQMIEQEGFAILRKEHLRDEKKQYVADHLRGGNWVSRRGNDKDFLPAMAIVVLDLHAAHLPRESTDINGFTGRIRLLKAKLRSRFDDSPEESLVHSTDTTNEGWEYVEICFPGESGKLRKEIEALYTKARIPLFKRAQLYVKMLPYLVTTKLRQYIVKRILK